MRRAEITGRDAPLRVVDAACHKAPSEGVLVRTSYAGLCHTDLHFLMADAVMTKRVDQLGRANFTKKRTIQDRKEKLRAVLHQFLLSAPYFFS